jgi:MFS family permease
VSATPPLLTRLRSLPAPVWILAGGQFVNKFGSFVLFFLILYLTRLGYSPGQAGLAAGAYGIGSFVAMFLGGHSADRFGRRATIVLSMTTSACLMVALSQARSLPTLTLLAGLAGLAAELYRPAATALMADLTPHGDRVTAFAVYRTAINLGISLGPAVAGLLAERSFLWIFLGDAATSLGFGAVAFFALPRGKPERVRAPTPGGLLGALRGDAQLLRLLVGMLLAVFCLFQLAAVLPLHVQALGFSTATYGLLLSLNGLLVALTEIPATSFTTRLPPRIAIGTGFLLIGLAFGGLAAATTLPLLVAVVAFATLGEVLAMPVAGAFVADLAPTDMRGRYQGALGASASLGVAAAPALGGALYGWTPAAAFLAFALAGLLAATVVAAPAVHHPHPPELADPDPPAEPIAPTGTGRAARTGDGTDGESRP